MRVALPRIAARRTAALALATLGEGLALALHALLALVAILALLAIAFRPPRARVT